MGLPKRYFDVNPDDPPPLVALAERRVRFEEVDPLGIVWHGRYVSFIEEGRTSFGDRYGLSYKLFQKNRVAAPIVQLHIDYRSPLYFDEVMQIEAVLHWSDALRLNFEYRITGPEDRLVATAYTVQLLTDLRGNTLLVAPQWIADFRERWKAGLLNEKTPSL